MYILTRLDQNPEALKTFLLKKDGRKQDLISTTLSLI